MVVCNVLVMLLSQFPQYTTTRPVTQHTASPTLPQTVPSPVSDFRDHGFREVTHRAIMLSVNHKMKRLGEISMPNHREYCKHHNIKYHVLQPGEDFETNFAAAWGKLYGLRNALLDGWDYAIWIDADAVFTNMTDDIMQHVDDKHDFFMTKDFNGLNSGVMIVRNTAWSSMYLNYLYGFRNSWPEGVNPCFRYEQRGFALTYNDICFSKKNPDFEPFAHFEDVRRRIKIVPSARMNAYECYQNACRPSKWKKGDTVFHVPGMGNKETRISNKLKSLKLN